MIAAALNSNTLRVDWFDAVLVGVLAFGLFRGRKNGMAKELIPMLTWLALALVSGLYYQLVARSFENAFGFDELTGNVLGYIVLGLIVYLVFSLIKTNLAPKLETSNVFGNSEFYLGMPAGMIRFACILLVALAFIHAKHYTEKEIAAHNAYVERWYGSEFFPDLHTIQVQVFEKSFVGPPIEKYLGGLLIGNGTTAGKSGEKEAAPAAAPKPVIFIGSPKALPTNSAPKH